MTTEEQFEDRIDFSILRPESYLYPFTMEDLPEEEKMQITNRAGEPVMICDRCNYTSTDERRFEYCKCGTYCHNCDHDQYCEEENDVGKDDDPNISE